MSCLLGCFTNIVECRRYLYPEITMLQEKSFRDVFEIIATKNTNSENIQTPNKYCYVSPVTRLSICKNNKENFIKNVIPSLIYNICTWSVDVGPSLSVICSYPVSSERIKCAIEWGIVYYL